MVMDKLIFTNVAINEFRKNWSSSDFVTKRMRTALWVEKLMNEFLGRGRISRVSASRTYYKKSIWFLVSQIICHLTWGHDSWQYQLDFSYFLRWRELVGVPVSLEPRRVMTGGWVIAPMGSSGGAIWRPGTTPLGVASPPVAAMLAPRPCLRLSRLGSVSVSGPRLPPNFNMFQSKT